MFNLSANEMEEFVTACWDGQGERESALNGNQLTLACFFRLVVGSVWFAECFNAATDCLFCTQGINDIPAEEEWVADHTGRINVYFFEVVDQPPHPLKGSFSCEQVLKRHHTIPNTCCAHSAKLFLLIAQLSHTHSMWRLDRARSIVRPSEKEKLYIARLI